MTYLIIGLFLITAGSAVILAISKERMGSAFIGIILVSFGLSCLRESNPQRINK